MSCENAKQAIFFFPPRVYHAYVWMASDNCETIISSVNVQMARLLSMFTRYILSIYQISIYMDEPIIRFLNERTMIKLIFVTICVDFNYNKHLQIFFHLQYSKFDTIPSEAVWKNWPLMMQLRFENSRKMRQTVCKNYSCKLRTDFKGYAETCVN